MDVQKALTLLEQYKQEIESSGELMYDNDAFQLWRDKVNTVIQAAFGKDSDEYEKFNPRDYFTYDIDLPIEKQMDYIEILRRHELGIQSILQKYEILGVPSSTEVTPDIEGIVATDDKLPKAIIAHGRVQNVDIDKRPAKRLLDSKTITIEVRKQNVFVVYGRDDVLRSNIFEFLRSLGLHPMKFTEAMQSTGKGTPYIGEVLESAFNAAQAVVVLLTGDDKVKLQKKYWESNEPSYETKYTDQPRPNVLFEAGMAFGVHPKRTILVQVGNIKPISDLQGRHVLKLDNSEDKRLEFADKLKTAGCIVDTSGNRWQDAGDFKLKD